jgi:hypothetical protein
MAIGTIGRRRVARFGAVVAAAALAVAVSPASPAQAFGNNRTVHRSCGDNWVSSGYAGTFRVFAQTQKAGGDCTGRLAVAIEYTDGYRTNRVYGTSSDAYVAVEPGSRSPRWGVHWGCDNCNQTLT